MKTKLIIALALLTFATGAHSAEQYLCIADKGTGFKRDNGKWNSVVFGVADEKYILRPFKEGEKPPWAKDTHTYGLFDFGAHRSNFGDLCEPPNENYDRFFQCQGVGGEFKLDTTSGRFLTSTTIGFWLPENEPTDPIAIIIGRCSKI